MTDPVQPKAKKTPSPLYGLKLEQMLTDISECYGWQELSEALNIERLQFHTGMKSTMKFLRNHEWAKEKIENCYLYLYKSYAWPDDKQLTIPPRDRSNVGEPLSDEPTPITAETFRLIDHASTMRGVKRNSASKSGPSDEPEYDPNNPWNT